MANFQRIFLSGDIMQDDGAGSARLHKFLTDHPDSLILDENVFANISGYSSTVADEISLILEPLCLPRDEMRKRINSVAHQLGIEELLEKNPLSLSGGQTQLVALASLFVGANRPLVLHALLQGLDTSMRSRVLGLLEKWEADVLWTNLAQPFAEEEQLATEILGETQAENLSSNQLEVAWNLSPAPLVAENLAISPEASYRSGKRKLFQRQVKPKIILSDLNLRLDPGEMLILRGSNGSGKTTLAKTLVGLLQPQDGAVSIGDETVHHLKPAERVARISMVGQHPQHRAIASTLAKDLAIGPAATINSDYLQSLVSALGLADELAGDKHPLDLTLGQQTLLSIVNALLTRPAILVLDEPTVHLSENAVAKLVQLLRSYRFAGGTVIGITHSDSFAKISGTKELMLPPQQ